MRKTEYKVIAKFKQFEGAIVQPYYVAHVYKSMKCAENFIKRNKDNSKFNFVIEVA